MLLCNPSFEFVPRKLGIGMHWRSDSVWKLCSLVSLEEDNALDEMAQPCRFPFVIMYQVWPLGSSKPELAHDAERASELTINHTRV
jgi:hypothetical protein